MQKKTKLKIIVPVNTSAFNKQILSAVMPVLPPDFEVDIKNITEGNNCIQNRYNLTQNAMAVIKLAKEAELEGCKGIFVTDFDMCGVEAAREVVDIPVIGGFRSSAFAAMTLSEKFSIITILESTIAMQLEHINNFGLNDDFASIRAINCLVRELEDKEKVIELVFQESIKAIEIDGAQSLILGCTGFIDIAERVGIKLNQRYGGFIPVIDPNAVALSYLVLFVRSGLTQSRKCYTKATM